MTGLPDKPFDSRISVDVDTHGDDVVSVPPAGIRLSLLVPALFIMFWLGGWAVGLVFALGEATRPSAELGGRVFLWVWLGGWTVGGVFAWAALISMLVAMFGTEQLIFSFDALRYRRSVLGISRTRNYPIEQVARFECRGGDASSRFMSMTAQCAMIFGKRRIPIGHGITDVEAERLAGTLNSMLERRRR